MSDDTFTPPHGLGGKPDRPDRRDRLLYAAIPNVAALPQQVSNEGLLPRPFDQGVIGSCTGWATATSAYAMMRKTGFLRPFMASPVFIYREARALGGYLEEDGGAELRFTWKAANRLGLPPMSNLKPRYEARDMPDDRGIFPATSIWLRQPSPSHYADAERRQVLAYFRLPTVEDLLQAIADGWCPTLGFTVFRSLYDASGRPRAVVPDPTPGDRPLGGHAVTAFGYDQPSRRVLIRNSWGDTAHEGGPNFSLSFDFISTYAWDLWVGKWSEGSRTPG